MRTFLSLLKKDFVIEAKTKELSVAIFTLSALNSLLIAFAFSAIFQDPSLKQRLVPAAIWIVFVFQSSLAMSKIYERELQNGTLDALKLTGIEAHLIYLSKFTLLFGLCFFGHILSVFMLSLLVGLPLQVYGLEFWIVSVLTCAAYVSLLTLLSAISASSRLPQILLPIISLPLLFPLFFAAIELSLGTVIYEESVSSSPWFLILIGLNAFYFLAGINFFGQVIDE